MNTAASSELRLNKALAEAGLCSRRAADELIRAGRVRINGRPADAGERVRPEDRIEVDGRLLRRREARSPACCLLLHKPVGVVSTVRDPQGRPTVLDLVPAPWNARRLYPAGRLDFFSEGLLLLTDDGELTHRLLHPSHHLPRVYHVLIRERVAPQTLHLFAGGMTLAEGDRVAPVQARPIPPPKGAKRGSGRGMWLEMILHQGLNRQIRRMCRDTGLTVLRLIRTAQGPVDLGDLPSGGIRPLTADELRWLRAAVGLA